MQCLSAACRIPSVLDVFDALPEFADRNHGKEQGDVVATGVVKELAHACIASTSARDRRRGPRSADCGQSANHQLRHQ
jgi:hypothetical protein